MEVSKKQLKIKCGSSRCRFGRGVIEHHCGFSIMLYSGREIKEIQSEETWIKSEITGKENQEIECLRAERDNREKKGPSVKHLLI